MQCALGYKDRRQNRLTGSVNSIHETSCYVPQSLPQPKGLRPLSTSGRLQQAAGYWSKDARNIGQDTSCSARQTARAALPGAHPSGR